MTITSCHLGLNIMHCSFNSLYLVFKLKDPPPWTWKKCRRLHREIVARRTRWIVESIPLESSDTTMPEYESSIDNLMTIVQKIWISTFMCKEFFNADYIKQILKGDSASTWSRVLEMFTLTFEYYGHKHSTDLISKRLTFFLCLEEWALP